MEIKLVSFDVDGVLLNSGKAHLDNIYEMEEKFKLELNGKKINVPSLTELRKWVKKGVKISPMEYFYMACGFPEQIALQANKDYQKNFRTKKISRFKRIEKVLINLIRKKVPLGIITSNSMDNIKSNLGKCMQYFDKNIIFTIESEGDKKDHLNSTMNIYGFSPKEILYVGDQPKDQIFAESAEVEFQGVTYGWGFNQEDLKKDGIKYSSNPQKLLENISKMIKEG